MSVLPNFWGRCFKSTASVALVLLSMTACAVEKGHPERPPKPEEPTPLKEVTFTIKADGELVIKDSAGKPIGDKCSTDPKSSDVCPIFRPGHKVQVEQMSDISITKYHGSPQCYFIIVNGRAYVIPGAAFCQ